MNNESFITNNFEETCELGKKFAGYFDNLLELDD